MSEIAVVGMGCRFPHAPDLNAFWEMLRAGEVCFEEIPADRWNHAPFYSPDDPRAVDKAYTNRGAFIDGVREFAALHFGLAPRRVEVMDPQHRLLIDAVRSALQDAGYERRSFDRAATGVFVGISVSEYKSLLSARLWATHTLEGAYGESPPRDSAFAQVLQTAVRDVVPMRAFTIPGLLLNMAPAAVSQVFDLSGPSFAMDAACSSGLVAVHEAILQLRAHQCNLAIAGGVYINLAPDNLIGFSRIGAVSRSGVCRPFDQRADGFVMGEGIGVVILKRREDAERDGDRIYALIKGSGCSNDGKSDGPMTPRAEGQKEALTRAYQDSGVPIESIGFLEMHGIGTTLGDAVEVGAFRDLLSSSDSNLSRRVPCYISSVKANIGHTMSAAGIAGLIKAVLVLQKRTFVPQPGCEQLNPKLELEDSSLRIAREATAWEVVDGVPRRAAVSSFGFGGTNVHVVLEESPEPLRSEAEGRELFLLSAGTPALLGSYARELARTIRADSTLRACDVAYTLGSRALLDARMAILARGREELLHKLEAAQAGPLTALGANGEPVLFPGRGCRLVTLPPTPLETQSYWGVEKKTSLLPAAEDQGECRLTPTLSHRESGRDGVDSQVLNAIARISAFPRERLKPTQSLMSDLGFDSLMLVELDTALGGLPRELFTKETTIGDIVAHLERFPSPRPFTPSQAEGHSVRDNGGLPIEESSYRPEKFPEYVALHERLRDIRAAGLKNPYFQPHERVTNDTTSIAGREVINFSSYNYLGLSGDPAVSKAASEAIKRYGTSVSASRLASGEKVLHGELESSLADFLGVEACLVFVAGYVTNVSTVGHLVGQGDLILHDALAHDSILQGCKLSGAKRRPFPHNDWEELDRLLGHIRSQYRRALVVIEGAYSMDGDLPELPRFIDLKKKHKALLMIDEAHSLGVLGATGRGIGEHFAVSRSDVDLWMGTLSKSLASCGGYIAGSKELVEYLKYTAPGFVYSVGISPPNAAAALEALAQLRAHPEKVGRLQDRSRFFLGLAKERGINTGLSKDSAIIPCIVGNSVRSLQLSEALLKRGINVQPILYPAVEENASRLRFFLSATHTDQQIRYTIDALAEELCKLAAPYPHASPEAAGERTIPPGSPRAMEQRAR